MGTQAEDTLKITCIDKIMLLNWLVAEGIHSSYFFGPDTYPLILNWKMERGISELYTMERGIQLSLSMIAEYAD